MSAGLAVVLMLGVAIVQVGNDASSGDGSAKSGSVAKAAEPVGGAPVEPDALHVREDLSPGDAPSSFTSAHPPAGTV